MRFNIAVAAALVASAQAACEDPPITSIDGFTADKAPGCDTTKKETDAAKITANKKVLTDWTTATKGAYDKCLKYVVPTGTTEATVVGAAWGGAADPNTLLSLKVTCTDKEITTKFYKDAACATDATSTAATAGATKLAVSIKAATKLTKTLVAPATLSGTSACI